MSRVAEETDLLRGSIYRKTRISMRSQRFCLQLASSLCGRHVFLTAAVIILWSVLLVATTLIVWAIRNLLPYEGESD